MDKSCEDNAVIFDMDGVLVNSMWAHCVSWLPIAEMLGISITKDEVMSFSGSTPRRIINDLVQPRLSYQLEEDKIQEIEEIKEGAYRDALFGRKPFPVMEGVIPLIESLHEHGIAMAVGSSSLKEGVDHVIELMQIGQYMGCSVNGEDVMNDGTKVRSKPAPDIFLLAAQRLGREPQNCLVIEDAKVGVEAAKTAGMKCLAFCSDGHTEDQYKGGKYEADAIIYPPFDDNALQLILKLLKTPS